MATVPVKPELIRWAIDRSRLPGDALKKFPIDKWTRGEKQPTLKQLEDFAKRTMTPVGYLFLDAPPVEALPVPDYRTIGDAPIDRPSPNLIDTLHDIQRRQEWVRDDLIEQGREPLAFVGIAKKPPIETLAIRMRKTLGLADDWARRKSTWEDALRELRDAAERTGVFVASSGTVGLNTRRTLDPQEFRGFVLCDKFAPFVFVNSADAKSAQMFTLAHELAHVWLGQDGLFNLIGTFPKNTATERFCNQVAAEFLIPAAMLNDRWSQAQSTEQPFRTIARWFKVSPIVAARRALDLRLIERPAFFRFYEQEQAEWQQRKEFQKEARSGGPNFYTVQDVRLSRRFAASVVRATREGRLQYLEAYRLTGLRGDTFNRYSDILMGRLKDEQR